MFTTRNQTSVKQFMFRDVTSDGYSLMMVLNEIETVALSENFPFDMFNEFFRINICGFLFAFLYTKSLLKMVYFKRKECAWKKSKLSF